MRFVRIRYIYRARFRISWIHINIVSCRWHQFDRRRVVWIDNNCHCNSKIVIIINIVDKVRENHTRRWSLEDHVSHNWSRGTTVIHYYWVTMTTFFRRGSPRVSLNLSSIDTREYQIFLHQGDSFYDRRTLFAYARNLTTEKLREKFLFQFLVSSRAMDAMISNKCSTLLTTFAKL